VKVTFKPFNKEVRNVRCMRCGEWGHRSGDRECSLKDFNPHDAARCSSID
jgi:CBF1 interacting corepressor